MSFEDRLFFCYLNSQPTLKHHRASEFYLLGRDSIPGPGKSKDPVNQGKVNQGLLYADEISVESLMQSWQRSVESARNLGIASAGAPKAELFP